MSMNVYETASELLSSILAGNTGELDHRFSLSVGNGVAPIDVAKFAIACEKAFKLALHDEDIADWQTLGDACEHIEALLEMGDAEPLERDEGDRTAWFY